MSPGKLRRLAVLGHGIIVATSASLWSACVQAQEMPEVPAATVPAAAAPTIPGSPVVMPNFAEVGQPASFVPPMMPKVELSTGEVIRESIFGAADKKDWKPLTLGTFFSEGWKDPFTNAPDGTNGAPKQNLLGAPGGVFGRYITTNFFYTNHLNNVPGLFLTPNAPFMPVHPFTNGNVYTAYSEILIPLNARMEIFLGTVFITSNKTSPGGPYQGNWGDTGIQARFHLIEQRNFSLIGLIGERIPTGKTINASGINYVTPGFEFWWNFADRWVLRGGSQINILTGRKSATSVYVNQLTLSRYLTTKDANIFKQLEVHVTASVLSDISGGAGSVNEVYIHPGTRFGLDKKEQWYFLGGVQVPVSGPQAYVWQPQVSITRNY